MSIPAPIYTPKDCRPAYQLNWSLSLFPKRWFWAISTIWRTRRDMKQIYQFGFYVGTFGKYDLGAIRHALVAGRA